MLELPGGTEENHENPRDGGCVRVSAVYLQQHRNDSQTMQKVRERFNTVTAH